MQLLGLTEASAWLLASKSWRIIGDTGGLDSSYLML